MSNRIVRRRPVEEEEDKRNDSDNEAPNRRQRTEGEFDGDATTEESESNPRAGWSPLEKHYERLQENHDPDERRLLCFESDPDEWRTTCFIDVDGDVALAKECAQNMRPAQRLDCYINRLKKRGLYGPVAWWAYVQLLDNIRTILISHQTNIQRWLVTRQTNPTVKAPKEFGLIENLLLDIYFMSEHVTELQVCDLFHWEKLMAIVGENPLMSWACQNLASGFNDGDGGAWSRLLRSTSY
jgi:hypothetical protein